jgi:hypothetical protein
MKRTVFLLTVIALTFCAQAGWNAWQNNTGDGLWSTPANWAVDISNTGDQPSIGHWNGDTIIECEATSAANYTGYSIISIGNGSAVGSSTAHGTGRLKVTGGTLGATNLWAANNPYDYAELIMDSGSMTFDSVRIGIKGRAIVNINGGTLTANSTFHIPYDSTNTKQNQLHINGGTVLFDSPDGYFMLRTGSFVNIAGGTLKVKSNGVNTVTTFENYAASGRLKAYNDATGAELNIVEENGYILITATEGVTLIPGWVPWDGEGADNLWTTALNWSDNPAQNEWPDNTVPNEGCNAAIGHFSATENDFAEITAGMDITIHGLSVGAGTNTTGGVGTLDIYGGSLNTSYIQMAQNGTTAASIDRDSCQGNFNLYNGSVNVDTSVTVARDGLGTMNIEGGTITSKALYLAGRATGVGTLNLRGGTFTVNFESATSNNFNIDNASVIDVWGGELKYNEGGLYGIDDFNAYASAGKIVAYSGDPRAQLNIASVDGYVVVNADIDDSMAGFPSPEDGAMIADPNVALRWTSGVEAVSHNVYFSDELTDVENASDTSSPYCIAAGVADPNVIVNDLQLGTTYYWRVDEVDALSNVVTGFIWSFTRVDYVAIETFDSYTDYLQLLGAGWSEEGGAYVDVVSDEQNVQDGTRAMFIDCYNDSAMTKTFASPLDFSSNNNNVSVLQLWIKGLRSNSDITAASIILTDTVGQNAQVYYPDVSDLMPADAYGELWNRWMIALSDFQAANASFDMSSVEKLSISIEMTGPGSIYVDSLYLLISGCYEDHYPAGDFNEDCFIDISDYLVIASDWLKTATPALPSASPVVWYAFDETSGDTAADSSGNGYNAVAKSDGSSASAVWSDQGAEGGCIEFDGSYCMRLPSGALSSLSSEVTVSLWINGDPLVQPGACIAFGAQDAATTAGRGKQLNAHIPWSSSYVYFDTGGDNDNGYDRTSWLAPEDAYKYGWNHYAFTKNTVTGEQKIYLNGSLVSTSYDKTRAIDVAEMTIGMNTNEVSTPYFGRIDDFRVYASELSANEILAISGASRKGDIANADNYVDEDDLGVFVANWLQEILWPQN